MRHAQSAEGQGEDEQLLDDEERVGEDVQERYLGLEEDDERVEEEQPVDDEEQLQDQEQVDDEERVEDEEQVEDVKLSFTLN